MAKFKFKKVWLEPKVLLSLMSVIMASLTSFAQQSLWVGQSYRFDVTSSVMGITANLSWSTNGGYLSLSGSGFYRDVTVTQCFSGTATVTCEWDYKLTPNGSYTHTKREVTISCRDNQVSISPTSLKMAPGETRYVSYRHQYDNQYTSYAKPYFQCSDPSICSVSSSGEVTAIKAGTTYINVYSKISSVAPYCIVTVEKISPTSIQIPSSLEMTGGETKVISPILTPSNAQAVMTWSSSHPEIATVNNRGEIKALRPGETTISVMTDNGLSANCKLTVNKGKLTLSSDIPSGWVEKNTRISLIASQPNAKIYYTIDESIPNSSSSVYSSPITVDKNLIIKAYASLDGFYDSEIETFSYNIRDFVIQEIFPEQNQTVHNFAVPYVVFNQPLRRGDKSAIISFRNSKNQEIPHSIHIGENSLFISPDKSLESLTGYTITIPENFIESERGESNKEIVIDFNTGSKIIAISYGRENAAIVKSDGSLWTWGEQRFGQLGNGEIAWLCVETPIKIMDNVIDAELSFQRGVALKSDGSVWSWGRNDSGYLGCGNKQDQPEPVKILTGISKIYCGESTSAAIGDNGSLYMWGSNYYGQIGDGSNSTALSPKKILSNVRDVAVRYDHAAAIVDNSSIYAWGHNCHKEIFSYGSYGNGVEVKTPWRLSSYKGSAIATTEGNTIFIDDGTVNICGINYHGIFGNGLSETYIAGMIKPLSNIKEIKSAQSYILALDNNNSLWGWGNNEYGQIGAGHFSDVTKPYKIMDNVVYFSAGAENAAAILDNGDVYAWGNNSDKQLLGENTSSKVSVPTKIFSGPSVNQIESVGLICAKNLIGLDGRTVFVPRISPCDASVSSIIWSSSDDNIATVSPTGIVYGVSNGVANISATIESSDGTVWTAYSEIAVDEKASVHDFETDNDYILFSKNNTICLILPKVVDAIKLYDLHGHLISIKNNCNKAEFHDVSAGTYIIQSDNISKKILVE